LIREIAQLGDHDIKVLGLLKGAFRQVVDHHPNLNDPSAFAEKIDDYRTTISMNRIQPENFCAACARLTGFGLALEVSRNIDRMHPHEYLYRPTAGTRFA
jgi:hypothetical protein